MNQVMDIIQDKIVSNKDILKLLYYDNADVDIYAQPNLSLTQVLEVVKKRVWKRKRKPLENIKECYISMWYGRKLYHNKRNSFFNGNTFNMVILCDNDIVENDYIGDRVCAIEAILNEEFDNADLGATCKCKVVDSNDVDVKNSNYSGRHVVLEFHDFNEDKYE